MANKTTILEQLKKNKRIVSFSEGRRHISLGHVKLNGVIVEENFEFEIEEKDIISHCSEHFLVKGNEE